MPNKHLATYLNDHLAGAVTAIELLTHLQEEHASTDHKSVLDELRADIAADRVELETIMGRVQVVESLPRKTMGWFAEKMAQLKLKMDDPASGDLRRFEALEVLAAGIDGKRALWRSLQVVADDVAGLQGIDLERLIQRAVEQRERVEGLRLEAAKQALQ